MANTQTRTAVEVNGKPEQVEAETVAGLLVENGLDAGGRGIAVAVNGALVPRARWAQTPLRAGDAVEIVQAKQGG